MRGVVSGANENHSGSQPSVGTYLDEQPVTTIDGTLDMHIYDIQRIEVLEGPQGTLYGASSEAGTVRIITNKPDPDQVRGGLWTSSGNHVQHGGHRATRSKASSTCRSRPIAAVRLVGWYEQDAGLHRQCRRHQCGRLHRQRRADVPDLGGIQRYRGQRRWLRTGAGGRRVHQQRRLREEQLQQRRDYAAAARR